MNPAPRQPVPMTRPGVPGLPPGASWEPRPTLPLPLGEGRGEGAFRRRAFSLVELLVVISIMLVLMALVGGGISAARVSQKKQQTQSLIARLDEVIKQQFATYSSRSVPATVLSGTNKSAARATYLRKLASAEMPDSWKDVRAIASGSAGIPRTPLQDTYVGVCQSLNPSDGLADAECLFMMIMQAGVGDCLDCSSLRSSEKGDTDGDGAWEFLDAWGNPIRYVLWPAALELPPGSGRFFSTTPPFSSGAPAPSKGGAMRPLIFSGGPDGKATIAVSDGGNFTATSPCENPNGSNLGGFQPPPPEDDPDQSDKRADNITNLDAEAAR